MNDIYICSDHHFFHKNIIKYANRPFKLNEIEKCSNFMIEQHNSVVGKDDVVIMVGDLSAGLRGRTKEFAQLLNTLNGKKILVRGNHDHLPDDFYLKYGGFVKVVDYIMSDKVFICHYPCVKSKYNTGVENQLIDILEKKSTCDTIYHGHIHNKPPKQINGFKRVNVCVDYSENNFLPILLKEKSIEDIIKRTTCFND